MLDEEAVLNGARNGNESFLVANVLAMTAIPALLLGGGSALAGGLFLAFGVLAPLNVLAYSRGWADAPKHTFALYLLALSPLIAQLALTLAGSPVLAEDANGNLTLAQTDAPIVSAAFPFSAAVFSDLANLAAAACGLSILFITSSRYIIRKILFAGACMAAGLSVFGLLKIPLETIPQLPLPSLGGHSFSTFADAPQWAAFGMLWLGAAFATALGSPQRFRLETFATSQRLAAVAVAAAILLGILKAGTPVEKTLALALAGASFALLALDTLPTKRNAGRNAAARHLKSEYKRAHLAVPAACYAAAAVAAFLFAAKTVSDESADGAGGLFETSIPAEIRAGILEDSRKLAETAPATGWGSASYKTLMAFSQGADLGGEPTESPRSDLLQKLVENGKVGLILAAIAPIFLFAGTLFGGGFSAASLALLLSAVAVAAAGVVDAPFQSTAVSASFWIIAAAAYKWKRSK